MRIFGLKPDEVPRKRDPYDLAHAIIQYLVDQDDTTLDLVGIDLAIPVRKQGRVGSQLAAWRVGKASLKPS